MMSLNSEVGFDSASGVEPRTSANNMLSSTSAPLSCSRAAFSQLLHNFELNVDGLEPIKRRRVPPIPAIGIPHSKQCGSLGIGLYILWESCMKRRNSAGGLPGHSPVRYQYQTSLKGISGISPSSYPSRNCNCPIKPRN